MKFSFFSIIISLGIILQPVQADIVSESEQILNDAQQVYPQFFPSTQTTQEFTPYLYRFFPKSGIYLGINQQDQRVYLLGGNFGTTPNLVDKIDNVKTLLKNLMGSSNSSGGGSSSSSSSSSSSQR